ncbi:BRI1 kinase inhibitor 1 [Silene latifolia]|uniref:BRI1 kinase inhibitor 1 n=1 Tax=Silene latifolia TaxID=37657 RepID=UPI003D7878A9
MESQSQIYTSNKDNNNKESSSSSFEITSTSSSPSHEFSFTISLHSSETTTTSSSPSTATKPSHHYHHPNHHPPPIDLSPADDIFFHGHLLPLHFLSHLHTASPRSSTTSHDGFTRPEPEPKPEPKPTFHSLPQYPTHRTNNNNLPHNNKPKSFSLSGFSKWIKGSDPKEKTEKKKVKFDVTNFLKRYLKLVKPASSPKGGRASSNESYSFSGNLNPKINPRELRSLRAEYSAPASMRTSPTNSGRILATNVGVPSPVSESTMEELQAAIQAAIAHCKNSTSTASATAPAAKEKSQEVFSPVPVN